LVAPTPSTAAPPKAYRLSSQVCALDGYAPAEFEHTKKAGELEGLHVTVHTYTARGWWGAITASCFLFKPAPKPNQKLNLLAGQRWKIVNLDEKSTVLQEREYRSGRARGIEIDSAWGVDGDLVTRMRLFFVGDRFYSTSTITGKQLADEASFFVWLDTFHPYDPASNAAVANPKGASKPLRTAPRKPVAPNRPSLVYPRGYRCAENGSCYGDISTLTGRPKTIHIRGYYRKDGTYVRGHYRGPPRR